MDKRGDILDRDRKTIVSFITIDKIVDYVQGDLDEEEMDDVQAVIRSDPRARRVAENAYRTFQSRQALTGIGKMRRPTRR